MTIKTVKYSGLILFAAFLILLAAGSIQYGRADILTYYVFLSSFFFLSYSVLRYSEYKITKFIFYTLLVSGVILPVYGLFNILIYNTGRASGLLGDRVFEADAAAGILIFLMCTFLISDKKNYIIAFTGGAVFLCLSYIIQLKVRTAYVAVFLSFLFLAAFLINRRKSWGNEIIPKLKIRVLLLSGIILLSLFTSIYNPSPASKKEKGTGETITSIFRSSEVSNLVRLYFWDASFKMFIERPLTGIGPGMWTGTFPKYYGQLYNDRNIDMNSSLNPHNDYLEFISEFGIAGLFYTLFMAGGFILLFKKSLKDFSYLPYLFLVFCFSITSVFNFTKGGIFSVLLLLISLAIAYSGGISLNKRGRKINNLIFYSSSVLLLLAAVLLVIRMFLQKNYLEAMNLKAKGDYGKMLAKLDGIYKPLYPVDMNGIPLDYYRGAAYFELNDYEKAFICSDNAVKLMPQYPSLLNNRASALYKTGRVTESIESFRYLEKVFPNYAEPRINLLAIYTNEKMYDEGLKCLNDIEKAGPEREFIKNYIVFLEIKKYFEKMKL
ncbi:MAG: O-antigen ligase family protein [Ignavibacteria bacterium]|nr:O-antigen ligase family protein [Ignavibacteria bacterium]